MVDVVGSTAINKAFARVQTAFVIAVRPGRPIGAQRFRQSVGRVGSDNARTAVAECRASESV